MKKIYQFIFLITIILLFANILPQWAGNLSNRIVVTYKPAEKDPENGFSSEKAGFAVQCNTNVKYSYHLWGGAADIYIDNNSTNAAILYNTLNDLLEDPPQTFFIGGLSKYKKTSNHGPFVHIDIRGHPSHW
ncbi:MAG: hypothetical protein ABII74_01095 [Elusimicrobiota bacterium]